MSRQKKLFEFNITLLYFWWVLMDPAFYALCSIHILANFGLMVFLTVALNSWGLFIRPRSLWNLNKFLSPNSDKNIGLHAENANIILFRHVNEGELDESVAHKSLQYFCNHSLTTINPHPPITAKLRHFLCSQWLTLIYGYLQQYNSW